MTGWAMRNIESAEATLQMLALKTLHFDLCMPQCLGITALDQTRFQDKLLYPTFNLEKAATQADCLQFQWRVATPPLCWGSLAVGSWCGILKNKIKYILDLYWFNLMGWCCVCSCALIGKKKFNSDVTVFYWRV